MADAATELVYKLILEHSARVRQKRRWDKIDVVVDALGTLTQVILEFRRDYLALRRAA